MRSCCRLRKALLHTVPLGKKAFLPAPDADIQYETEVLWHSAWASCSSDIWLYRRLLESMWNVNPPFPYPTVASKGLLISPTKLHVFHFLTCLLCEIGTWALLCKPFWKIAIIIFYVNCNRKHQATVLAFLQFLLEVHKRADMQLNHCFAQAAQALSKHPFLEE